MNSVKGINDFIESLILENKILSCKLFLKYEIIQIESSDGIVINIKPADIYNLSLLKNMALIE